MNLEELERDVLRGARRDLAPATSDRERHQAELMSRLGAAHGGKPLTLGSRSDSASALGSGRALRLPLRGSHFGMLGVGLLVGAMVGGWFGFGLGRRWWGGTPPVPSTATVVAHGVARGPDGSEPGSEVGRVVSPVVSTAPAEPAPFADEAAPTPEALAAADGVKPSSSDLERTSRATAVARPRSVRAPAVASPESSLAAELAMLQRARRALAAENGGLALGIVEELDERFPKGLLLEERTATRVLSLCKLARIDAARREALRFLERYPASVYAERVRQSCAGLASE